jgi:hypothetical protein
MGGGWHRHWGWLAGRGGWAAQGSSEIFREGTPPGQRRSGRSNTVTVTGEFTFFTTCLGKGMNVFFFFSSVATTRSVAFELLHCSLFLILRWKGSKNKLGRSAGRVLGSPTLSCFRVVGEGGGGEGEEVPNIHVMKVAGLQQRV